MKGPDMTRTRTLTAALAAAAVCLSALSAAPALAHTPTHGSGSAGAAVSAERKAPQAFAIKAKINKDSIVVGEGNGKVKITGKVTPKAAGAELVVQQRLGDRVRWGKTGTVKVKKNGTFSFTDKPRTRGERVYRVMKPASKGAKKVFSNEVALDIWKWSLVEWIDSDSPRDNVLSDVVKVGGKTHYQSLALIDSTKPGFVEFTLGRKCTALRTAFALSDSSVTGATGTGKLTVDGAVVQEVPLSVGAPVNVTDVDVTNAFRVRFDLTGTASPVAVPAVLDPKALCL